MFRLFTRSGLIGKRHLHTPVPRFALGFKAYTAAGAAYLAYNIGTVYLDEETKSQALTLPDPPTLEQIEKLWRNKQGPREVTNSPPRHGVSKIHSVLVPSEPCDDFISVVGNDGSIPWTFFGLYDGHNGTATGKVLHESLIEIVAATLRNLYIEHNHFPFLDVPRTPPPEAIDNSIRDAFHRVDDQICNGSAKAALSIGYKPISVNLLEPAFSGSCAMMGFYDHETRQLHVALAGDSRAVLGRRRKDSLGQEQFTVEVISSDKKGERPAGEAGFNDTCSGDVIVGNDRVLGREITRTFGDAKFKWSSEIQEALRKGHLSDPISTNVTNLPQLTAMPEITTTDIEAGDFVIMATHGLWKSLTDEEVVGLVGMWANGQYKGEEGGISRDALPVDLKEDKTPMYRRWGAKKRFLNVDENVAVHLARNALGGADTELFTALLIMPSPMVRKFREDISVIVTFFDDPKTNDGVTPEAEA